MQIGTSGLLGNLTKRSTFWISRPGGQRSRSPEAEDRFGGLAETSFSTTLGRVTFLVYITVCCLLSFLPRDATHKRYGLCRRAVSVRLRMCHVRGLGRNEYTVIFSNFRVIG